jgi:hypothetical protein
MVWLHLNFSLVGFELHVEKAQIAKSRENKRKFVMVENRYNWTLEMTISSVMLNTTEYTLSNW